MILPSSSLTDSYAWCRRLTRQTAENFRWSFLALSRDRYDAMCALYAFMRITDDLGDDESVPLSERSLRLDEWRRQVANALAGDTSTHPALPALQHIVTKYSIPTEYLFHVIEGVSRDLQPVAMATFSDLEDYCYHVAGAVGLCCIHIWGFRDPAAIPLAIDCGQAFQLTNILRDISEDARADRIYLPLEDLQRFGVTRDDLLATQPNERVRKLVRFEAERAQSCYQRAEQLLSLLEPCGRPILRIMLDVYGGLLDEIVRRDGEDFTTRVRLPRWKKLWFVARALCCRS